jgi:sugar lactone lactonase YvrE
MITVSALAQKNAEAGQDTRLIPVFHANEIWNGVTTTADGRVFVGFPHLDGSDGIRVAELSQDGKPQPYPDAGWNRWHEGADATHTFVHVNALRIGPDKQLWIVDTGAPGFGGSVVPGGVKIVVINPQTNRVSRIYPLDSVTSAKSYIDDLRFHGRLAYITDAGIPGLIVLDLESGKARRLLDHHQSTTDERPMMASGKVMRTMDGKEVRIHADQLEVSPDGKYLYFQPCSGPLYRIETRFLDDASIAPAGLSRHVERWVDTPTTGGTAIDAKGSIYLSDVNKRSILRISPAGKVETLIQDSRLDWVDAMWIDQQGYLWMPAAQLDQIAPFQKGVSRVNLPIYIYKLQVGVQPEY